MKMEIRKLKSVMDWMSVSPPQNAHTDALTPSVKVFGRIGAQRTGENFLTRN